MMELKMTTNLAAELPAEIGFNFDELKTELTERLDHYNSLVVTEDAIQEAKGDRAKLRKLKDAIDTHRKEVKQEYNKPLAAFEARCKELTALIDAPIAAIDGQVKAFEEQEREKKRAEIAAAYEELVPEGYHDIIPLDRILDPKWLNKSTTMKSVREALETLSKRTYVDVSFMEATVDPKYLTAVRAEYIKTLDLDKALEHRNRLEAAEQAFQQREAQQATIQHQTEEKPPVAAQEPVQAPEPTAHQQQTGDKLYSLRLEFHLTMAQANDLKRFLADSGIQYTKIK